MSIKVAAVTNLNANKIDVHKLGCKDLSKTHFDMETVDAHDIRNYAIMVFGEVEDVDASNASDFIRILPCSKK